MGGIMQIPIEGNARIEVLKDGTAVLLREPTMDDVEGSLLFYRDLPPEDRRYLRADVTNRNIIARRIQQSIEGRSRRIVALVEDNVVAIGILEFSEDMWRRHIGEIRVAVAPEYQRRGLGRLIIADLFHAAEQRGVEKIVAKMAAPQTVARKIFERLGFHVDSVLPEYIKDADGNLQSLVVMSCTLDELSQELKGFFRTDDWPDG
jgi:ribosomal protein S18 acetylase RimI-like enzyme